MPSLTLPTVLNPSDLVDYLPTRRVMQLLYDDDELDEGEDSPSVSTIDENDRAIKLARTAWYEVMTAVRRGNIYGKRELIDLANDEFRGGPLVELVASIFYCKLLKRRRYVSGEPQADEGNCEEANASLERLRAGERIFALEGVAITGTDGSLTGGLYENELGEPTTLSVGQFRPDSCGRLRRFWGCTDRGCSSGSLRPTNGGCGGDC